MSELRGERVDLELQFKRARALLAHLRNNYPDTSWESLRNVFCIVDETSFFFRIRKVVDPNKVTFGLLNDRDLDLVAALLIDTPLRQADSEESLQVELEILARGQTINIIESRLEGDNQVIYYQIRDHKVRVTITDSIAEFELGGDTVLGAINWSKFIGDVPNFSRKYDIKPAYSGQLPFHYLIQI